MLNEFYNYIASNTVGFFQSKCDSIRPGERYCLRLDNEDMVRGVDDALRSRTNVDGIQGQYKYKNVYETFTIRLSDSVEVVVASKTNGSQEQVTLLRVHLKKATAHFFRVSDFWLIRNMGDVLQN